MSLEKNFINRPNNQQYLKSSKLLPPMGFILQKDIYNTNLLYANNQFPLRALRKNLPFRPTTLRQPDNPGAGIQILRENGNISDNGEEEKTFYSLNTFHPKKLDHRKLRFPLPKIKTIPLSNSVFHKELCRRGIKIKYMEDDNNISTKSGKKLVYNIKENNVPVCISACPDLPSVDTNNLNKTANDTNINNKKNEYNKNKGVFRNRRSIIDNSNMRYDWNYSYNEIKNYLPMNLLIGELSSNLKLFDKEEKERKRSFIKDSVFPTQINSDIVRSLNLLPITDKKEE